VPLRITPRVVIPDVEIDERFLRASGPGGQNVNKVATAVELRFDVRNSRALSEGVKRRLLDAVGSRATAEGVLIIVAREHRTQERNRSEARRRLAEWIAAAIPEPRLRRKTKPTAASRERRLADKRHRKQTKLRRSPLV
jgi:ribosome-associated protein